MPAGLAHRPRRPAPFRVKGVEVLTWWPSTGEDFQDYTHAKGRASYYPFRFGPYKALAEPEYAEIGGPLLSVSPLTPNPKWIDRQREMVYHSYTLGDYAEIGIFDPWGWKHQQWGDIDYIDAPAAEVAAFGHAWTPWMDAWVDVVADNFTCMGHVIIDLGNEAEQIDNYDPNFYRQELASWRAAEKRHPCKMQDGTEVVFVHAVGGSIPQLFGELDYTITHTTEPLTSPIGNRWTINNERGKDFAPAEDQRRFKVAYDQGLSYGLWRGGLNDADFEATLAGRKAVVDGTAPPPSSACPKPLAEGAVVYLNDKVYGQGFDSTVRVKGDPEFCRLISGVETNDCHLEGWPARTECEMELLGATVGRLHACPIWQFTEDGGASAHACVDDRDAFASCDHQGSVEFRDDPQTPTTGDTLETLQGFEGRPLECGLQRDEHGPLAGFFCIAHGKAEIRACRPDGQGCGPWREFDH